MVLLLKILAKLFNLKKITTSSLEVHIYKKKKTVKILTVKVKTVKTKLMTPFHKIGSKVPFCGDTLNAYNAG